MMSNVSPTDLAALKKASRFAGLLTLTGVCIVLTSIGYSVWRLGETESELDETKNQVQVLTDTKKDLEKHVSQLRGQEKEVAKRVQELAAQNKELEGRKQAMQKDLDTFAVHGPEPLPVPTSIDKTSFRLPLDRVVGASASEEIRKHGKLVFHVAGNTGGANRPVFQIRVADAMVRQLQEGDPAARPAFFYILGNIAYYFGEASEYPRQFYEPYGHYSRPIFAIPGNRDNDRAFLRNFCSPLPIMTPEAGTVPRKAMIQPNVYWTLESPYATIIGLYTGVNSSIDDVQKDWLIQELKNVPTDKALIIAMHHSVYGEDTHVQNRLLGQLLDVAMKHVGRAPDLVLSAHANLYIRFMRKWAQRDVPYVVVGTGGYPVLRKLRRKPVVPASDVMVARYDDAHHGFLRVTVIEGKIVGEYFRLESASGADGDRAVLSDRFEVGLAGKLP